MYLQVDRVVVNKYFGLGQPDYSKILRPRSEINVGFENPDSNIGDFDSLGFWSDTAKRYVCVSVLGVCAIAHIERACHACVFKHARSFSVCQFLITFTSCNEY